MYSIFNLLILLISMLAELPWINTIDKLPANQMEARKIKSIESTGPGNDQFFAFIRDIHNFNGQWIISDFSTEKVFVLDQNLKFQRYLGGKGKGPGEYVKPTWIFSNEDTLYLVDDFGWKIMKYNKSGEPIGNVTINSENYHGNKMVRNNGYFYTTYYCSSKPIRRFNNQTVNGLPLNNEEEIIINWVKEKVLADQKFYELRADLIPYKNDQLMKVYYYQPMIELYDILGHLIKRIDLPVSYFDESVLKANKKEYEGSKKEPDFLRLASWYSLYDSKLYMLINEKDNKNPNNRILILDLESGHFSTVDLPGGFNYRQFAVHQNSLIVFNRDLATLELFKIEGI